jgi:hypothetical protein
MFTILVIEEIQSSFIIKPAEEGVQASKID